MRSPGLPNDPAPRGGRAPGRPHPDDRGSESSTGGLVPAGAEDEADDIGAGDGDGSYQLWVGDDEMAVPPSIAGILI